MSFSIPVIDLFAGPGGLSEGFSRHGTADWSASLQPVLAGEQPFVRSRTRFEVALSVEMDEFAHQTLELRALVRKLESTDRGGLYSAFLTGALSRDGLFDKAGDLGLRAKEEAWRRTLGEVSETLVDTRIAQVLQGRECWVLIGGPPCQAYSLVGRARNRGVRGYRPELDKRNFLYQEYLRIVARHRPPVFVMENVKGLLSSRVAGESMFERIHEDLSRPDLAAFGRNKGLRYELFPVSLGADVKARSESLPFEASVNARDFVVRMEHHGIPQARHRVILLGVRSDLNGRPCRLPKREPVWVRDILADLPALRSGLSGAEDSPKAWRRAIATMRTASWFRTIEPEVRQRLRDNLDQLDSSPDSRGAEVARCTPRPDYADRWYRSDGFRFVLNHTTRSHIRNDLHRYLFASTWAAEHGTSPTLAEFPEELLPAHGNVHMAIAKGGNFNDRFRVQVAERCSTTITSHISKDGHYYIHFDPTQCRSLTVREAARLQTFPDDYFFCGSRTEQYRQVGNAVPPLAATQIASLVARLLA
jgi:DNA (cytosine-5)-methyltransferase 1